MSTLTGKVALVTGASRGIGAAIAKTLAREGALVGVHYSASKAPAEAVVAAIEAAGGKAFTVQGDLAQTHGADSVAEAFLAETRARTGQAHLDILVHNAGVAAVADLANTTHEAFDRQFAVNVRAPFFLTQKLAPHLREGGRVLLLSSAVSRIYFAPIPAYAATKGAVDALTLYLAGELGPRGVTVNAVAPGVIETDMAAGFVSGEDARRNVLAQQTLQRIGQPDDVAALVAALAGPGGAWTTGQVIDVSGGTRLSQ
ncbi:MAG: SDR family oxidoreductase [Hyphomonadaceae bacterium]|nr:SDR family oxidoreductase [Hyphomonadaceae bacterium]